MSEMISKALLSGLGLASLTKKAVQQMGADLSKRAHLSESEGRRLVKDLEKRTGDAQQALQREMHGAYHAVLKRLNLATMDDVRRAAAKKKSPAHSAARKKSAGPKRKSRKVAPDAPDSGI